MSSIPSAVPRPTFWERLTSHPLGRRVLETAAVLLVLEALVLIYLTLTQPSTLIGLLWAQVLVCGLALRTAGFFKVFGPVMFYDLLRASRRRRYLLIRVIYLMIILSVASWVYFVWISSNRDWTLPQGQLSAFALTFFAIFMVTQLVAVVMLTPAYVAGAVSEEKERKTLEFMLATDLRDSEIVIGKLMSRLSNVLFLVLAGLPVLCAFQYMGGVDPNLVAAGFVATLLLAGSLAAVAMFASVTLRKTRDAIALTYIVLAVYIAVTGGAQMLTNVPIGNAMTFGQWLMPGTESWTTPLTGKHLLRVFGAGNPVLGVMWVFEAGPRASLQIEKTLPLVLGNYALFHAAILVGLPAITTLMMRRIALREAHGETKKEGRVRRWFARPAVGLSPLLWKELWVERGIRFHWLGRLFVLAVVGLTFLPPALIVWHYLSAPSMVYNQYSPYGYYPRPAEILARDMNVWVRGVTPFVGSLLLLAVAVRAAGAVTGERAKNTWDELMTTPVSSDQILFAKWAGAILSVRWGWLWLMGVWMLGVATGGVTVLALPPLVFAWLVYAALLATIGLRCSIDCKTTLVSTLVTLVIVLLIGVGHWLITGLFCYLPIAFFRIGPGGGLGELVEWLASLQAGLTPPAVFLVLPVRLEELNMNSSWSREGLFKLLTGAAVGIGVWGMAAGLLYLQTMQRFRKITNRVPLRRRRPPELRHSPLPLRERGRG